MTSAALRIFSGTMLYAVMILVTKSAVCPKSVSPTRAISAIGRIAFRIASTSRPAIARNLAASATSVTLNFVSKPTSRTVRCIKENRPAKSSNLSWLFRMFSTVFMVLSYATESLRILLNRAPMPAIPYAIPMPFSISIAMPPFAVS